MRKLCCFWLLRALLWLVAGCGSPQTEPTQTEKPVDAGIFYSSAKKAVASAENLLLEYTLEQTRTVGDNTFTKQVTGKASYQGYARDGMLAKVEETQDFGYYRCGYSEIYYEAKAYATVNDSFFWTNQSPEDFVSRQLPPVLLTPSVYDTVTYSEGKNVILFSDPRQLEAWVGEGELLEASGEAVFDAKGTLQQTRYQVRYRKGEAECTLSVTVQVTLPQQLDLSGIQTVEKQNSVWLSNLDAPRKLVQVVADVYSAKSLTCQLAETITSEAVPLSYTRSGHILFRGRDDSFTAEVVNASELSNNRGVVSQTSQKEQFQKGVYTVSVNGGEPSQNGGITAVSMRQYCEDTILSGLLAVKYLRSASAEAEGKLLRLELGGSIDFREMMNRHLQNVLQVDLDALASVSEYHGFGGYLTVDMETGLPVAFGMFMGKSHTMDGVAYRLDYRLDETLAFP